MEAHQVIILEESGKREEIPLVKDFENICRICLINFTSLDISKRLIEEVEDEIKIKSLLQYYTPIKISANGDHLPQHLCIKCTKYLIDIHVFQCTSLLNEDLLHKVWQKSQKQQEKLQTNQDVQQNNMNKDQLELNQSNYVHSPFTLPNFNVKNTIDKLNKEYIQTHTRGKPYVCVHCNAAYNYHRNLASHLRIHFTEKPICEICGKNYSSITSIKSHWRTHIHDEEFPMDTATNSYKCVICKKSFETNDAIKEHMLSHEKKYLCPTCGKCFSTGTKLNSHQRVHVKEKPYKCSTCDKAFVHVTYLKNHEVVHQTDTPFECPICHEKLKSKILVTRHKLYHQRKPLLPSVVSGEKSSRKSVSKEHKKMHKDRSDLRKFECEICKKRFLRNGHLKCHLLTHTGERHHVCEICKKAFPFEYSLKVHIRTHTGERPYKCRVCSKAFKDCGNCKQHERYVHSSLELKNAISNKCN